MDNTTDPHCPAQRYFDANVRVLALPDGWPAQLLFLPIDQSDPVPHFEAPKLSSNEKERLGRFRNAQHGRLFALRRQFRRYCAQRALGRADWPDFHDRDGHRPVLKQEHGICFSFSSSDAGLLGGWCHRGQIGFDIESARALPDARTLAAEFFSINEARAVTQLAPPLDAGLYLQLWCLKEAALKSIGQGLPYGLDAFTFEIEDHPRCTGAPRDEFDQVHAHLIDGIPGGFGAAVWNS